MRKPITSSVMLLAALCATGLALASPDAPLRYAPRSLDRGLVTLENPVNGQTIAAWAYRSGGRYDLAVAVREAGSNVWSEPQIFGASDSFQQEQPALTFDPAGNAYLVYSVRETGQILLTTLREGATQWAAPIELTTGPGRRGNPQLRIVAGRLVVAYRTGSSISMVDLPLLAPGRIGANGSGEGPDTLPGGSNAIPPTDDDGSLGR